MRKFVKYGLLVLGWLLTAIVLLIVAAGLLIQTSPVKKKIATVAEKKASQILSGDISIGEVDGNFFNNLTLKNILWTDVNDTTAFIKQLDASYELRPLLNGELLIHKAIILNPYFQLKQNKDSVWNVQNLVESEGDKKNPEKSSGNFSFEILNFEIADGTVEIHANDTLIPREINQFNTQLSLRYSSEEQNLELGNLSFKTINPGFSLEQLSVNAERNKEEIQLLDFYLKTAHNRLQGEADYVQDTSLTASVNLTSDPLHLNEFEFFIPGLNLPVSPTIDVKTEINEGRLNATINVADGVQNVNLKISSRNFAGFIENNVDTRLNYDVTGELQNVDLAHWLGNPKLKYLVNGKLEIYGEGTDPKTAVISLDGDFRDVVIHEKPVDKLLASLHLENGNLNGTLEGQGNFGSIDIKSVIHDFRGAPAYQVDLSTKNFNLAELIGNDSLRSDINLSAQIEGKNFDPKKINASANVKLSESTFRDVLLDTLVAQANYQTRDIQIDSLYLETQTTLFKASGNYSLKGNSDLLLEVDFAGLEEFTQFLPTEELFAEGSIAAHLKGIRDSLDVEATFDLKNILYDNFSIDNLLIDAGGRLTSSDTVLNTQIALENFRTGNLIADSVNLDVNYLVDSIFVKGRVEGEEIETYLEAGVRLGPNQRIIMENWSIDYKNQHFDLQNPPAIFELDSTQYRISNFKLVSDISDSAQFVSANGIISRTGEEDFQLEAANINIEQLLEMLGIKLEAAGILDVKAEIQGTADNPIVNAEFGVNKTILNEYEFSDFSGKLNLQNNKLIADVNIIPVEGGKFVLKGEFPVSAKLDSMKFDFDPGNTLDASLVVEQFPLDIFQNIKIAWELEGFLEGNVELKGTLEAPEPEGNFHLVDASLEVPEYGIDYENITLNIEFLPEAVNLDSFYIKSEDGTLKATGTINFNDAFYKGDVSESEINVNLKNFNPVNHRQFNLQLSGDASLAGKKGDVVFSGDLNVPESELYLPAIFNMLGRQSAPEIPDPILIREMKNEEIDLDSLAPSPETLQNDTLNFSYLDNFTGTLNLEIPKNSWIKNNDMHIEISGDLELRKNAEFFELFGSVDVVRGQYDLLGKTFIIDEGSISFQGGEELMPRIDITASHSFRNAERAEQELTVQVTGTAEEPNVNFSLDGSNVSEGDALSYILFGKSMDELSIDQQQNVAGSGSLAGTAAAALLSSQITNFLGEKLDVDYIEIKSEGGEFDNATVVVGKYITNDLFVSYEQRFGETNEKEMAKYEVKLEYELFKFLFLQLNNSSKDSGFDVIFKLSSE